ncbi:hypothetical protein ACO34A_19490 [Rhizobium sp. ACO-34A]|nr:SDR family NAD(P)-dependent oxidoreductase [Rhizobium sp. ACO-34A]ATN35993.1 hypothetical protein ACO34A_19490 [Rhizobium sp. ACO-34A]
MRAIVTGATGGIGRAIVEKLLAENIHVIATGTRVEALEKLSAETGCETRAVDICKPDAVEAVLGGLDADVLVHAAGILGPQMPIHEMPPDMVASILDINITGTINLLRSVVPGMRAADKGTIILLGSICGTVPGTGPGVYSASKAALQALAANLRYELYGNAIRVSEIRLGRVRTGIHNQLESEDEFYEGFECVLPENVAETVFHIIDSPAFVDLSTVEMMPTRQVPGGARFSTAVSEKS